MRILIAGSIQGDSGYEEEFIIKNMVNYLNNAGHVVDSFMLPYKRDMLSLPDQILAYQMIDTSIADMLITVGYPACTLRHKNKIVYVLEMSPMLHEYWDSEYGVIANAQYSRIYETINNLERQVLSDAKKIVCNSQLLCDDIARIYSLQAILGYYPNVFDVYDNNLSQDKTYYICETSLMPHQRIELLLDVVKVMGCAKWLLYVPKSDLVYMETLKMQIEERKINENIIVCNDIIPDNVIKSAIAYFAPEYNVRKIPASVTRCVSLGTPVITCEDSGAVSEYVTVYKFGYVEKKSLSNIVKKLQHVENEGKSKITMKLPDMESFMRGLLTL